MRHKGQIISTFKTIQGSKITAEFKLSMESNSNLTASIMCAYIKAICNLKQSKTTGAFTCLDIPISMLFLKEELQKIITELC
jgi:diaminopimelate dehydrogenase